MGYSGRSVRDSGTEYDLNCRCLDQEVSERKNVGMGPVNQSGDILVKNVAVPFCPSPKSFSKAKVKRFGLIVLTEEISKQSRTISVKWLLVFILINLHNEKQQAEDKRSTRK